MRCSHQAAAHADFVACERNQTTYSQQLLHCRGTADRLLKLSVIRVCGNRRRSNCTKKNGCLYGPGSTQDCMATDFAGGLHPPFALPCTDMRHTSSDQEGSRIRSQYRQMFAAQELCFVLQRVVLLVAVVSTMFRRCSLCRPDISNEALFEMLLDGLEPPRPRQIRDSWFISISLSARRTAGVDVKGACSGPSCASYSKS